MRARSTEPQGTTRLPAVRSNTSASNRTDEALMNDYMKFKSMGKTKVSYDVDVPLSKAYVAMKSDDKAKRREFEKKDKGATSHAKRAQFGEALRKAVQGNGRISAQVGSVMGRSSSPLPRKARIDSEGKVHDTVDWSFMELATLAELVETEPRGGRRYKADGTVKSKKSQSDDERRAALRAEREERERAQNLYCFFEGKRSEARTTVTGDGITILKAKGETYAFKLRGGDLSNTMDDDDFHIPESDKNKAWKVERLQLKHKERKQIFNEKIEWEVEGPAGDMVVQTLTGEELALHEERLGLRHCTIMKCSNNSIVSIANLSASMKRTLYRPHRFLSVVDFSSNKIEVLPEGISLLECLSSLLLHDNNIPLEELPKLRLLSKALTKLTLFHNPLQNDLEGYYKEGVSAFLPTLRVLDNAPLPRDMSPLAINDVMAIAKRRKIILPPI